MKHCLLLLPMLPWLWALPMVKDDPGQKDDFNDEICVSRDCIGASFEILKYMNETVDPCDDFYEFTCKRFLSESRIPDDKTNIGIFSELTDKVYEQSRDLLEDRPHPDDFESYAKARKHYQACVDEELQDMIGHAPLKEKLKLLGGWPVLDGDTWDESAFDIYEYKYKLNVEGLNYDLLFQTNIEIDSKNTSYRVLTIDDADLGARRENLVKGFDDSDVQLYYKYMVASAVLLGAGLEDAESQMKQALQFEIELAHLTLPQEEKRNATKLYNPTTIGQLNTRPGLPSSWKDHFNHILSVANQTVDLDEKVIVSNLTYLEHVANLVVRTPKRTLANYFGWRVVREVLQYLGTEARKIQHDYIKGLHGKEQADPAWKRCVGVIGAGSFTTANFVFALGSMYAKKHFKPEAKNKLLEMSQYLKTAFNEDILDKVDWMDDKTKQTAKEKLQKMESYIGYQDEMLDKKIIDGLYDGLIISESDFFGNALRLRQFWRKFFIKRLREKVDKRSFIEHRFVVMVNAFYFPDQNVFEFPAGILQGAFYNPRVPNYLNYGAIGFIIGHEITHGFDDQGKQRDEKGEIRNWWEVDTEKNYLDKAKCIIEQYGNYSVDQVGMKVNGITTQGENIADNGGIKEAYLAYRRWVADNGPEPSLVGLPYTPYQLFWISMGRSWCAKYRDGILKQLVLTDSHAFAKYRIIGPLTNNPDFARDFKCPSGSRMNPVEKCAVW